MTEIKRPLSLQLNPTRPTSISNNTSGDSFKTPINGSPVRPTSILSPCTAKRQAIERPKQLTSSASSGSLASSTWSTTSTTPSLLSSLSSASSSSSSSSSTTSSVSPKTPSPTQTNNCSAIEPLDSPSLILPYLYVGDQAQTQIDTISSLNISYILSLQSLPKFLDSDIQLEQNDELLNCDNYHEQASKSNSNHNNNNNGFSSTHKSQLQMAKRTLTTLEDDDEDNFDEVDGGVRQQLSSFCNGVERMSSLSMPDIDSNIPFIPVVTKVLKNGDVRGEQQQQQQPIASTSSGTNGDTNNIKSNCKLDTDPCDKGVAKDLLPSMNSSKDYLVKFRSCVDRLIKGKCINISDTFEQLVDKFFDETHNFIEEARRNRCNILVHCKAGISRSPTIAIAYLMKWKRLHLQDAYDFVKRCRPQISPNLNFMGQLMKYERRLLQRRFQKCPLPSPTTFCLSNRPYHEELMASLQLQQQQDAACAALLSPTTTITTTPTTTTVMMITNTTTADNTNKTQDLNAPRNTTSASQQVDESFPMSDETVHFTR